MSKRKLSYKTCKQLLDNIHNNTSDLTELNQLLEVNSCSLDTFIDGISNQAFLISAIKTITHAKEIKNDLQKDKLSIYLLDVLLSVNYLETKEEALFEIEKFFRKKEAFNKYKILFEDEKNKLLSSLQSDTIEIDFLKSLEIKKDIEKLKQFFHKMYVEEVHNIESEVYSH